MKFLKQLYQFVPRVHFHSQPTSPIVLLWILSLLCGCTGQQSNDLEVKIKELSDRVDKLSKGSQLDLQEKCSKAAKIYFIENYPNRSPLANYGSHYNSRLNICLILSFEIKLAATGDMKMLSLENVFDNKNYGSGTSFLRAGNRSGDIEERCDFTPPDSAEVECKTLAEFQKLAAPYMKE
jgi:hypothetical protein